LVKLADNYDVMSKEKQKGLLEYALRLFRDMLVWSHGAGELLRVPQEELTFVQNFSKTVNFESLERMIDEVNTAYYHIERNVRAKMVFLDLSLTVAQFFPTQMKQSIWKLSAQPIRQICRNWPGTMCLYAWIQVQLVRPYIVRGSRLIKNGEQTMLCFYLDAKKGAPQQSFTVTDFKETIVRNSSGKEEKRYVIKTRVKLFGKKFSHRIFSC
jgi:hypothetical protein